MASDGFEDLELTKGEVEHAVDLYVFYQLSIISKTDKQKRACTPQVDRWLTLQEAQPRPPRPYRRSGIH